MIVSVSIILVEVNFSEYLLVQQDVREAYAYFFCRARMRSRKSARMNKSNFTIEKIVVCTHDSVFEIVVYRNVDNCIQLLA